MDSFSTCSVAGNEGGGGLVGSDMNKTTDYKRCYSAGPVVKVKSSGSFYGGFAGRIAAITLDDCSYNKNFYTSADNMKGAGQGGDAKIAEKTTKEMEVTGTCKTEVYDTTLNGKTYPYRPVNTTGIVLTDASGSPFTYTGMYYGDWEEPEPQEVGIPDKPDPPKTPEIENLEAVITDGYVYAYREKIEGKDGWYWYILTASGTTENNPIDYLVHANNVQVQDGWEYGFLLKKDDKFNSKFTEGNHPYADAETVKLKDKTTNPYHIRREDQLRKITGNYFPTKKYIQDCGFTVSGSLPVNTVTAFSGTYDATFEKNKNKRYNIEHKGTGDSTKLFNNVTGTVKAQINGNTVNQP